MRLGNQIIKIVKGDSWKLEAQTEVRHLIATGWRLIQVFTELYPSNRSSFAGTTQTIYYKLEKTS